MSVSLDWEYDEDDSCWLAGDKKNGCGVTKVFNEKARKVEWWARVVVNGCIEPWGPFASAKLGREKAEAEWKKRTSSILDVDGIYQFDV
jgi:hypothetical protein